VDKGMAILSLELRDFKNYGQLRIEFCADLNGMAGPNGAGKTNILDALYYLCTTKGYFNGTEQYNFRHGTDLMQLKGLIALKGYDYQAEIRVAKGKKKELLINKARENKLSEYVGKFPVVIIAPDDNQIILGGSEERRRLLDSGLCQADSIYTDQLLRYNKILQQRNALLKQIADSDQRQDSLLDTIDEMLVGLAQNIYQQRKEFCNSYSSIAAEVYQRISGAAEAASIQYHSHLDEYPLEIWLKKNRDKDILLQRTTKGVHLDDLDLQLDGHPVKKVGSQGQQKTFVVALKMGLYALLKDRKNLYPALLLDDIFEKFDEERVSRLFEWLGDGHKGQIFISDTHPERLEAFMSRSGRPYQLFQVNNGEVNEKRR
jgi:DNA replication and repair protein RecF